jgi:hypothetical protein
MKPKTHGKLEYIPAVKLYREDLDALLSLFQSYCDTVTISDADSEYESLDELKHHVGSRVRTIELAGTKPNITLALTSQASTLRHLSEGMVLTSEETDRADLLFSRTREFLLKRKRLLARVFTIQGIVVGCLAVVTLALFLNWHYQRQDNGILVLVMLFGIMPIVFIGAPVIHGGFRSVTLDSQLTASSFWKRNGDHILLLAIGTIIGVGGTLLSQWLAHHLLR